jgi:cell division GTPase FtsZ
MCVLTFVGTRLSSDLRYSHQIHIQLSVWTKQMRVAAEKCESLQSFFVMHSMGGGTGSGLGTYILSLLEDAYPSVFRFVTAVFPSEVSVFTYT